MNAFTQLFLELDQTNKMNDKIEALEIYFKKTSPQDRLWAIALFTGRRPKRMVSDRDLKEWMREKTQLPDWLFDECRHVIGDLAETCALLLPPPVFHSSYSLSEWMQILESLRQQPLVKKKKALLDLWNHLEARERFVFNKILVGSFRLGVAQNLLIRALANVTDIETHVIAHRLMGDWHPTTVNPDFLLIAKDGTSHLTRPYPFCLAYPLDQELEALGPCENWTAEWKWDGIRGQIVFRENIFTLWSRGEERVNERFPELVALQAYLPVNCVLDGEILACKEEKILPFQLLQQRLGRKTPSSKMLKEIPVIFLAYDLLEREGKDLRHQPFYLRRKTLEELFSPLPTGLPLCLSPQLSLQIWEDLRETHQRSRAHPAEGMMLKKKDSIYHVGRKRGDWWKWKREPLKIDAVLLYAEKGHGWRANVFSDYTFAVWQGEQLIPFAKAYAGLNKEELAEIDRFIKKNTLEKFGPVRSVKPELVFEIAFEGIQLSKRHKSGVAVRFPRIQRWRKDKTPQEADTIETLRALLTEAND